MRTSARLVAASVVGLCVLSACPAGAASRAKPQISDRAGDWAVGSQDITSGTISAARGKVVARLTLVAPPAAGVRTTYAFGLYIGCTPYVLTYTWGGSAALSSTARAGSSCNPSDATSAREVITQPRRSRPPPRPPAT